MGILYSANEVEDLVKKINALIDERYESVKSKSATCGELKENLERMERSIAWMPGTNTVDIAAYVGKRSRKLLDIEMGDQRIRHEETRKEDIKNPKGSAVHTDEQGPRGEPGLPGMFGENRKLYIVVNGMTEIVRMMNGQASWGEWEEVAETLDMLEDKIKDARALINAREGLQ